jgi:hypothetical protein
MLYALSLNWLIDEKKKKNCEIFFSFKWKYWMTLDAIWIEFKYIK